MKPTDPTPVPVKGFDNYIIYPRGNKIWSVRRKKFLAIDYNNKGYLRCRLFKGGEMTKFMIHRLVALHFVKNKKPNVRDQVNHDDKNTHNNDFDNLTWMTGKENIEHSRNFRRWKTKEEAGTPF